MLRKDIKKSLSHSRWQRESWGNGIKYDIYTGVGTGYGAGLEL